MPRTAMLVTPTTQEQARRWPALLASALWVLTLLALPMGNWLDQLLRQAGLPELAILEPAAFPLVAAALTAATVGAVDLQASKGQQLIHAHHITAVHPTIGAAAMDEFGTTAGAVGDAVPDQLRALFNNPDDVRVQQLPCVLPGLDSLAVHFGAGARTVPHQHNNGQHLVFVEGVGVVADEDGVHVVRAGDVVSNPLNAWHWHGATPGAAATHVTFEAPGDFDLAVERRDWDDSYGPNLGT